MDTFKKTLIAFCVAGVLLFILVAAPCAQTATTTKPPISKMIIDCRDDDMDCLIGAAKTCQPTTLTNNVSQSVFDQQFSQTVFYEIKGGTAERCELHLKILDWQVKTVEMPTAEKEKIKQQMNAGGATVREMTEEEKKQSAEMEAMMKKRMKDVIGTSGICTYQAANLAALFERWKNGKFSTGDYKKANCRGTYFTPENGFYNYAK